MSYYDSMTAPRYDIATARKELARLPNSAVEALNAVEAAGLNGEPVLSRDEIIGIYGFMSREKRTFDQAMDAIVDDLRFRCGPQMVHEPSSEATVEAAHQYMRENPGAKYETALKYAKEGEAVQFKRDSATKARLSRPTPGKTKPVRLRAPKSPTFARPETIQFRRDHSTKLYFSRDLGPLRSYDE